MKKLQAIYFHDFNNSYIPHILKEVYIDQIYRPFVQGKKDLTIVDLGANIGLTSFYFKDYAKQIYAVEPAKEHIECIDAMIKQNDIKNIEVCPYAISAESGTAKFYHNDNVTMFSLKSEVNKQDDYEEVQTLTMTDFMKKYKIKDIDILKFDIEGSEGELITSEGFIKASKHIKVILGEWHTWSSMNPNMFANTLRDLGYQFDWTNKSYASTFTAIKK